MIRLAVLPVLAAVSALSLAVPNPAAAQVQVTSKGPVVKFNIVETAKSKPDQVRISAGVTSNAPTAVDAMRLNAKEMSKVVAQIKALGIGSNDIQTTGVNLNAEYDYNRSTNKQVFKGYRASNRVSVTLNDVSRTGPVLDALVAAGATDLSGPNFSIADTSAIERRLRKKAMENAAATAREYASLAGFGNVSLLEVQEGSPIRRETIVMSAAKMSEDMSAAPTPVEPGLVGTSLALIVTYQLLP